jgi:aspartate racemase
LPEKKLVQAQAQVRSVIKGKSALLSRIATELYSAEHVFNRLESQKRQRPKLLHFVPPETETEQQLAQIWTQLLRLEQVGIQDNFFELGGTSLLAVRLFTQIEQILGKTLPLATLLQAPTIEQLSRIVCFEESSAPASPILAIQPAGSKPPLFCIAGAGGDTFYFHDLSNHLGLDQPVYGLQAQGFDGKQAPHTRIEEMAAYCIEAMRTLQSEGPYFLGGHSAGGLVAFEMAQQLQKQGQKVALLALFDPSTPEVLNYVPSFWDKASAFLINFIQLEPKKKLAYVLEIPKYRANKISKKIASQFGLHSEHPLPEDLGGPEFLPREIRLIFKVHEQAARNYVPQVYQGRVTLFKATDRFTHTATWRATWHRYPLLGWDKLVAGGLEVHEVPGSHSFEGSLLSEPHVRVLAEKLKSCLDSTYPA